jgi:hypothetical protein
MVSMMMFTPANTLSISLCTRPTSDFRNSCIRWSSDASPSSSLTELDANRATEDLIRSEPISVLVASFGLSLFYQIADFSFHRKRLLNDCRRCWSVHQLLLTWIWFVSTPIRTIFSVGLTSWCSRTCGTNNRPRLATETQLRTLSPVAVFIDRHFDPLTSHRPP